MKSTVSFIACAIIFSLSISEASAGEFLKCERRLNPQRSRISVESEGLVPGALYTAMVFSAGGSARASIAADAAGVAEYDFDSNINDILAGATRIAANFVGRSASAKVTDAMGNVVDSGQASCRVK
jgi:hypothetical protein